MVDELGTCPARSLNSDPWEDYWRTRQGITVAMRRATGMQR